MNSNRLCTCLSANGTPAKGDGIIGDAVGDLGWFDCVGWGDSNNNRSLLGVRLTGDNGVLVWAIGEVADKLPYKAKRLSLN